MKPPRRITEAELQRRAGIAIACVVIVLTGIYIALAWSSP